MDKQRLAKHVEDCGCGNPLCGEFHRLQDAVFEASKRTFKGLVDQALEAHQVDAESEDGHTFQRIAADGFMHWAAWVYDHLAEPEEEPVSRFVQFLYLIRKRPVAPGQVDASLATSEGNPQRCDCSDPMCRTLHSFQDQVFQACSDLYTRMTEEEAVRLGIDLESEDGVKLQKSAGDGYLSWAANVFTYTGSSMEAPVCRLVRYMNALRGHFDRIVKSRRN